ncbi:MAG: lipopolysaccharide heptosyltransferase I, partial [Planctomycetia bacterium]|nr:lipopolysaccharide heptosyltransferase I [Planctomycetia bacterium]
MRSLLIVKLSSLGDVIHTLPAAQALRRAFPSVHLGWAIDRAHAGILARQTWLDEVIEHDRRNVRTFADFIRRLRQRQWDVAVDFQGLLRSGLVT